MFRTIRPCCVRKRFTFTTGRHPREVKVSGAAWFRNRKGDVRSSYALEETASEFESQGLELDWVGICWDANYRCCVEGWDLHKVTGTRWNTVKDPYRRMYVANTYKVLLTRGRQGMVILVPYGSDDDPTRQSDYYAGTFSVLEKCGIDKIG